MFKTHVLILELNEAIKLVGYHIHHAKTLQKNLIILFEKFIVTKNNKSTISTKICCLDQVIVYLNPATDINKSLSFKSPSLPL